MQRYRLRRRKRRPIATEHHGNSAVPVLQTKLRIGSPDSRYEREADSVADRVMAMQPAQVATRADAVPQRKCEQCEEEDAQRAVLRRQPEEEEEDQLQAKTGSGELLQRQPIEEEEEDELQAKAHTGELLQRQPIEEEEEEELQAKATRGELLQRQPAEEEEDEQELQASTRDGGLLLRQVEEEEQEEEALRRKPARDSAPDVDLPARLRQRHGGVPLAPAERAFFEPRFGADFTAVRIHADSEAAAMASAINARAFTVGADIYFNRGEYRPGAHDSRHLVAHELTHTLQQGASRAAGDRAGSATAAPPAVQRKVVGSRVSCESYPRSYPIFSVIGTQDPTGTLQTAVTRALALLDDAIETLRYGRSRIVGGAPTGWPTISDTVGLSLRRRLRIDPDSTASWTGTGPRTVHQAIRWYGNIRRILASDFMHYTCIDSDCKAGDHAAAIYGQSRIYLCRPWWHAGLDEQAITLIHEASHIYYDTEDSGRGMGSAYCLENFICDINGLTVCEGC